MDFLKYICAKIQKNTDRSKKTMLDLAILSALQSILSFAFTAFLKDYTYATQCIITSTWCNTKIARKICVKVAPMQK